MPLLLNDPTDWAGQAQEARRMADQNLDPEIKAWLTEIAKEYERLARRAAKRFASNKDAKGPDEGS
jgi:hypothetical protein